MLLPDLSLTGEKLTNNPDIGTAENVEGLVDGSNGVDVDLYDGEVVFAGTGAVVLMAEGDEDFFEDGKVVGGDDLINDGAAEGDADFLDDGKVVGDDDLICDRAEVGDDVLKYDGEEVDDGDLIDFGEVEGDKELIEDRKAVDEDKVTRDDTIVNNEGLIIDIGWTLDIVVITK